MARGRFVFVSWNGGGNTPPTYLLARRLIARGHQVSFLGQTTQAAAVRDLGASFVPLSLPEPPTTTDEVRRLLFGPAVGESVLAHVRPEEPDVLLIDCMLISGLAAAERLRLPSAALVHVLYHTFALRGSSEPGTFGRQFGQALPTINQTRAGFGLPPVESTVDLLDPMTIALVSSPQEFDLAWSELPANLRYVGAIRDGFLSASQAAPWPSTDERPRVLVAFSTTYQGQEETLRRVSAALTALPVQGVITVGHSLDPAVIPSTANVTVRQYIPHGALLPACALVVTHAGLGTVMASLAHGVPLLCMPMGRDQHDNAARVAACGAGIVLDRDAEVDEIRETIQTLLTTPSYHAAAASMAAIMAHQDGPAAAVQALEALLGIT